MFFENLDKFGDQPALIDAETSACLSYMELEKLIQFQAARLPQTRQLVFIEASNSIPALVIYLACLRLGYVVYLLESLTDEKTLALIELFKPNFLISLDQTIKVYNDQPCALHPDLLLLLSTSGSTGTPKFVKLSANNIQSNAEAIAQYLNLDANDCAYSHLKPFYSYGLSVIHSHLAVGASLLLATRSVTEPEFLQQIKFFEATSFAGVPYTFETLARVNFSIDEFPHLRYLTQAGGKLVSHLVVEFARQCQKNNKSFYVMYGQTEAAPRMSYLPAEFATRYPDSIGLAIPGGELFIVDENKQPITQADKPGELAYRGPNVMMGYAVSPDQLASDQTPACLYTGDIACKNSDGLFYIVGRTSRFVKMFGLRINLDQVQTDLKRYYPGLAVTGNDQKIVIALNEEDARDTAGLIPQIAKRYQLPDNCFFIKVFTSIPLLASGKYDYKKILAELDKPQAPVHWFSRITQKVSDLLELNDKHWLSITDLFRSLLSNPDINQDDSFESLNADSLSFVALSIELENALGDALPANWRSLSLAQLDTLYLNRRMAA